MIQSSIQFTAKNGQHFEIRTPLESEAQVSLDMMVEVAATSPYILSTPESFKGRSVENQIKWFKESAESDSEIILAVYSEGRMIGFCNGRAYKDIKRKHRAGLGVSLRHEYRGLGIGQELMRVLIESMKKFTGIQIIELEVMMNNKAALQLYENLGFKKAGIFPKAFILPSGEVSDSLAMYLEVST
ncbi:GNAT family N-acetyltransferase [Bdellovibrio sp. NC01]|uniref:GNAT family N-acetyltransferase n=1 Tax=Bdellovibrio sp. NC01 TaxID=2220073 RepID=UPI00115BE29A|nr:GNAT family N-acetyltransferase [Bdellovibrio sp. NC01]QDK37850.1 GNAT family N-acetyltransferase [Bdellovibrio sp. NC01]